MPQLEKVLYIPGAVGLLRGHGVRRIAFLLVAIPVVTTMVAYLAPSSGPLTQGNRT